MTRRKRKGERRFPRRGMRLHCCHFHCWGGSGRWSRLAVHRVDSLLDQRVRDMARRSVG